MVCLADCELVQCIVGGVGKVYLADFVSCCCIIQNVSVLHSRTCAARAEHRDVQHHACCWGAGRCSVAWFGVLHRAFETLS